jgi:hypothetical protein
MANGPKNPATDPSGEITPQRRSNREGARKTEAEHLLHRRDAEKDSRTGERRPESEARETSDGSLTRDREKGHRNTDEV